MTEIEDLKKEIELLKQKLDTNDVFEKIATLLDKQSEKPRKQKWNKRQLAEFPDGKQHYVTEGQLQAKDIVDKLIRGNRLALNASEAALNKFLGNEKIRDLPRSLSFWAKQYYKSYYLKYPTREVKKLE